MNIILITPRKLEVFSRKLQPHQQIGVRKFRDIRTEHHSQQEKTESRSSVTKKCDAGLFRVERKHETVAGKQLGEKLWPANSLAATWNRHHAETRLGLGGSIYGPLALRLVFPLGPVYAIRK